MDRHCGAALGERDTVVLLDASAGMAVSDRFQESCQEALRFVETHGDVARVIVCGAAPVTVMNRSEDPLLLAHRIEKLSAESSARTFERVVRQHVRSGYERPIDFVLFSDHPIDVQFLETLPDDISLTRRVAVGVPLNESNRAITAIGCSGAVSGLWDRVDVFVEIRGTNEFGGGRSTIEARLDGAPYESEVSVSGADRRTEFMFRDIPARGQVFEVTLVEADDNTLDDRAEITLPNRAFVRVALSPSLETMLRPVLEADPGVVIADGLADVSFHREGEIGVSGVPSLVLVSDADQEDAFLVDYTDDIADEIALVRAFGELGLEHIDTQSLAEESTRSIRLGVRPASQRRVSFWAALLSPQFDFVHSRAFPIFVARSIRFLADVEPITPFAASAEPLADTVARTRDGGTATLDPIGAAVVPPRAGRYRDVEGRSLSVSLSDPDTVLARSVTDVAPVSSAAGGLPAWSWIALFALGLIVAEWFAYRTGRMP